VKAKHTPGPWNVKMQYVVKNNMVVSIMANHHNPVNFVSKVGSLEDMANARLIAAAPDLLQALQSAKRLLELVEKHGAEYLESQFGEETAQEIEDAIQKAGVENEVE